MNEIFNIGICILMLLALHYINQDRINDLKKDVSKLKEAQNES